MAKILLVEDNEQNRDMLVRRLQRKGHLVVTAGDGERAVTMAGSELPDLILMDLNLPVLDGWLATRRIKDSPLTGSIPVIALTAHAMAGDRQRAMNAGCDDYDTKPVEFARLMDKIQALLGRREVPCAGAATPAEVVTGAAAAAVPTEADGPPPAAPPAASAAPTSPGVSTASTAPAERPTATAPFAATAPSVATARSGPAAGRVLVVDDTAANRDMLARRLVRHGYDVEVAFDGESALASIANTPFDLVLLDVMMPGISGLDVLKTLRATRAMTDLPVIMATAKDAGQDIVEALELGANDYVTKPLDFPVVLARVRTQLSLKRSVEQIRLLEKGLEQRNAELDAMNARMREDLEAAAKVQEALLPEAEPVVPGYRFGWRFLPSAWLAGDILNVFRLDERHAGLYLLDVSGHGVAAALLSVTVSRFLSPARDPSSLLWRRDGHSGEFHLQAPAEVAARLSARFPFDDRTSQYFTLVYGLIDLHAHTLRYVSAGHPAVVRVPATGTATMLQATGYPIGVGDEAYDEYEVALGPGDRLFVYSDGVPEAMDDAGSPFGTPRLLAQLDDVRGASVEESLTALLDRVDRWRGRGRVHDDVSVLAVERAAVADAGHQ